VNLWPLKAKRNRLCHNKVSLTAAANNGATARLWLIDSTVTHRQKSAEELLMTTKQKMH
jgi:hypothetical protein